MIRDPMAEEELVKAGRMLQLVRNVTWIDEYEFSVVPAMEWYDALFPNVGAAMLSYPHLSGQRQRSARQHRGGGRGQ